MRGGLRKPLNIATVLLSLVAAAKVAWSVPPLAHDFLALAHGGAGAIRYYAWGLDGTRETLMHLGVGIAALVLLEMLDDIRWRRSRDPATDAAHYVLPSLWRAYQNYRI